MIEESTKKYPRNIVLGITVFLVIFAILKLMDYEEEIPLVREEFTKMCIEKVSSGKRYVNYDKLKKYCMCSADRVAAKITRTDVAIVNGSFGLIDTITQKIQGMDYEFELCARLLE